MIMKKDNDGKGKNNGKIPWSLITKAAGLTKAQITELRDQLLAKRQELASNMTDLMFEFSDASNGGGDSNELLERASELEGAEMAANLYSSQWGNLSEIEEALERMGDGTYGVCMANDEPIGIARLRARPWAKHCIKCASQFERTRSRSRPSREELFSYPEDE